MNKILKTINYCLLIGFLSFGLNANESDIDEVEDEVNSLMVSFDKESLVEISNRLIRMASNEEEGGDYYNAVKHYRQTLVLRERLGLANSKGYANLLLLTSNTEHNFGASCDAKDHVEKALGLYKKLHFDKEATMASEELREYSAACMVQTTQG
ncbi:tetratricopeptide repeat protein [Leptospira sp. GIMC2001]|uniref:tetratricopeptide repeat protein n=1 Tax=Leptospira sp. GIMC2001 TaxID=1513297 RepID=UPI002349AA22|nr:hypothetical protein [Leptospira sp. GIMC2001]WCL48674.1 hypothetical protein O4O04_15385 [Leptospira sp. GIMC2001]